MMMMPEPARPPSALGPAEQIQKQLLAMLDSPDPIPSVLQVGGSAVPVQDFVQAFSIFQWQRWAMEQAGIQWPQVALEDETAPRRLLWAPLDLETRPAGNLTPEREAILQEHALAADRVAAIAQDAGFTVSRDDPREVLSGFTKMVASILGRRFKPPPGVPPDQPPNAIVEVTTDSHGADVLYATGYYVSTKAGFGRSTARRTLPWGKYIFGVNRRGRPWFSNVLREIPVEAPDRVSTVHLHA